MRLPPAGLPSDFCPELGGVTVAMQTEPDDAFAPVDRAWPRIVEGQSSRSKSNIFMKSCDSLLDQGYRGQRHPVPTGLAD